MEREVIEKLRDKNVSSVDKRNRGRGIRGVYVCAIEVDKTHEMG